MDIGAPGRCGLCRGTYNIADHDRVTTNDAYLEPARGRETLTVQGETLINRVQFKDDRATNVVALGPNGRTEYDADAVELAAGAIHTPEILVCSSVGPADHLRSLGVTVESDRPGLGRLLDHPQLSILFRSLRTPSYKNQPVQSPRCLPSGVRASQRTAGRTFTRCHRPPWRWSRSRRNRRRDARDHRR